MDEQSDLLGEIGKYRVRLVRTRTGESKLDVREYVKADTFEGYTRKGIRVTLDEASKLVEVFTKAISAGKGQA